MIGYGGVRILVVLRETRARSLTVKFAFLSSIASYLVRFRRVDGDAIRNTRDFV